MLSFLPAAIRGAIAFVLLVLNTLFWCAILFVFSLAKLVLPFDGVRRRIDPILNAIATHWISCNALWQRLTQATRWQVTGVESLAANGWYLVNANHQSWVDILVLQRVLNKRIPFLKFFLKQELIYVPVIGIAWWALDFPFMKRHSAAAIKANPALRQQDLATTRRACARFSLIPTSVMNFSEGTRFTPAKHAEQASPYQHLLKPKAGALALAVNAMGEKFNCLLDVTIAYPEGAPSFWQFLCGRTPRVILDVATRDIPREFAHGDYTDDPAFRETFQAWLTRIWDEKDARLSQIHTAANRSA
jgi:1-acyl-sn-glycerol-3-phosphate acyltransferase